jgi:hypothetical protein
MSPERAGVLSGLRVHLPRRHVGGRMDFQWTVTTTPPSCVDAQSSSARFCIWTATGKLSAIKAATRTTNARFRRGSSGQLFVDVGLQTQHASRARAPQPGALLGQCPGNVTRAPRARYCSTSRPRASVGGVGPPGAVAGQKALAEAGEAIHAGRELHRRQVVHLAPVAAKAIRAQGRVPGLAPAVCGRTSSGP